MKDAFHTKRYHGTAKRADWSWIQIMRSLVMKRGGPIRNEINDYYGLCSSGVSISEMTGDFRL